MNDMVKVMDRVSLPDVRKQRAAILELEKAILNEEQEHVEPIHTIHAGMYARTVTVPQGMMLTGAIYKYDHIEIMSSGKLLVTTDNGSSRMLTGFNIIPALSGKKRAAFAVEDTTWTTIHSVANPDWSGDKIQEYITAETFEELEEFYAQVNNIDFINFCKENNWHPKEIRNVSEIKMDQCEVDLDEYQVSLRPSIIEGTGLFTDKFVERNEVIMPARIADMRTQAGRYCNHALRCNAKFERLAGDYNLVATQNISEGEEITVNYRQTMSDRYEEGDLCQE